MILYFQHSSNNALKTRLHGRKMVLLVYGLHPFFRTVYLKKYKFVFVCARLLAVKSNRVSTPLSQSRGVPMPNVRVRWAVFLQFVLLLTVVTIREILHCSQIKNEFLIFARIHNTIPNFPSMLIWKQVSYI